MRCLLCSKCWSCTGRTSPWAPRGTTPKSASGTATSPTKPLLSERRLGLPTSPGRRAQSKHAPSSMWCTEYSCMAGVHQRLACEGGKRDRTQRCRRCCRQQQGSAASGPGMYNQARPGVGEANSVGGAPESSGRQRGSRTAWLGGRLTHRYQVVAFRPVWRPKSRQGAINVCLQHTLWQECAGACLGCPCTGQPAPV